MGDELICDGCSNTVTVEQDFYCDACRKWDAEDMLAEAQRDQEDEILRERMVSDWAERTHGCE